MVALIGNATVNTFLQLSSAHWQRVWDCGSLFPAQVKIFSEGLSVGNRGHEQMSEASVYLV